jgi:hypothetical protein
MPQGQWSLSQWSFCTVVFISLQVLNQVYAQSFATFVKAVIGLIFKYLNQIN